MALTVAIEGLGSITTAESITNWNKTGTVQGPAQESDLVLQGSYAVSVKASGKSGWLYYDYASAIDFTTTYSGECVYIWLNCTTLGGLNTLANTGLAIRMGSSTSNYRTWTIGGSDGLGNGYNGGWLCAVIDPNKAGSITDTGSYSAASVQLIGVYIDNTGSAKSENLIIDQIAVGSGLRVTGSGATDGWQDVADYCNDYTNRAWGMLQEQWGVYYMIGELILGDSTQTAVTSLTDDSRIWQFGDFEYYSSGSAWVTALPTGYNKLTVEDAASYTTTFQDGVAVGSDAGRNGSIFIGSSETTTTFDLYGGNAAGSATSIYASTFSGIDGGVTFGNDSDHKCFSAVFVDCGQVDPVGAIQIRNCLFINTQDTGGALLWNANIDIEDCQFIANTTGPAIEHPAEVTDEEYHNLTFSGNTYDINNAVNATQVDAYADTNRDTTVQLYSGSTTRIAQSFTGTAGELSRAIFSLQKAGTPSGNVTAKLYSDSSGPSAVLATSEDVAIGDIGTSWAQVDFEFEDEYTLAAATTYWISVEYSGGDSSNRLEVGVDNSSPGHSGSCETYNGSWSSQAYDLCFYVNRDGIVDINATNGANPAESKTTETGSPKGATIITNAVTLTITVQDASQTVIQNVQTAIYKTSDDTELMNEDTNASGIASESFNYPGSDVDVYIRVRKSSTGATRYVDPDDIAATITADGLSTTITLYEDEVAT